MADEEQLAILKQGVSSWNEWRKRNLGTKIDLSSANFIEADLTGADLAGADFGWADLSGTNFRGANLHKARLSEANLSGACLCEIDLREARLREANCRKADLSGADLSEAYLRKADFNRANLSGAKLVMTDVSEANLRGADLSGADLRRALLSWADLSGANLSRADLSEAYLNRATLIGTSFREADLTDCRIYGISAWDVEIEGAVQKNLIITEPGKPALTVDDMEVAQFIYLLLNNRKVKNVIDTITSKAVLILGRFTEERKKVLDAIRDELRQRGYVPILFDFEPSASRDLTETVTLLARMARFIIADLTDPKSIPQELTSIIPDLPSVPVQPIILRLQPEYAMYEHWRRYPWVQEIQTYDAVDDLLAELGDKVIAPAERAIENAKAGSKASS